MNTNLLDKIEAEYDAYCEDDSRDLDSMYAMLSDYLKAVIAMTIKDGSYIDEDMVEELTQDALIAIATDKIHTFQKREAKFTTFCVTIAKNKALDYVRHRNRQRLFSFDEMEGEGAGFSSQDFYHNPESLLMQQERRLEQIETLRQYLQLLMSQKGKPYRTVGCCYTMVLFHRYHPDSKELSSPKWAFEEVREDTVEYGADRFVKEINVWFPRFNLYWGDAFLDGMEDKEEGIYISDMIFGEHFRVKDFENWSLRMRKKIREEMFEQACEVLE
ncbi:MAG: RNA polymerase sigma factor [Suilimivivens sp.]